MRVLILVVTLIFVHAQLPEQLPPKFALLTVTHAREGQFDIISNYLKHYAEADCYQQLVSQICIIWNNQELPESVGLMDRELYWRMPVYFYYTKNNSLNHRFRTPRQASADLFYSLDDDIIVDCPTLNATYMHYWKSNQPFPNRLVSNEVRSTGYMLSKLTEFYYQGHSYAQFFTIAQTGATFFPKHYLSLYYLQIEQIEKMRTLVDKITSCEDIFFMAIGQHFYPEMMPQYVHPLPDYRNTDPKVGLSRKKGLVPLRTSCINFLTDTLGYNPLRLFSKNTSKYASNWKFSNIDLIMQTKIRGLGRVQIQEGQQNEGKENAAGNATAPSQFVQRYQRGQLTNLSDQSQSKVQGAVSPQQRPQQQAPVPQKPKPPIHEQKVQEGSQIKTAKRESFLVEHGFQILVVFLIFVIVALLILILRLLRIYNRLKDQSQKGSTIVEQEEYPMTTHE